MKTISSISTILLFIFSSVFLLSSCSKNREKQSDEQISASSEESSQNTNDSLWNSVTDNVTMKQIASFPSQVILTGLAEHRLVSIYKSKRIKGAAENFSSSRYDSDEGGDEFTEHFMPGIDILFGYNLLNIAHYDLLSEKANYLFNHPVLIKTFYYPSFLDDSLYKKPIKRNYYLVSAYDEDTNKDTLINKKDLRRFYLFDAGSNVRTQLLPPDYSTLRSQYDPKNDVMYIFARRDENKNGTQDKTEPIHVFWISLANPGKAKLMY